VVTTLVFDRLYGARREAATSTTDEDHRYLDMLSGFGVFALGRVPSGNQGRLRQALDADLPGMVRWTVPSCRDSWRAADYPQSQTDRGDCSSATRRRGRRSVNQVSRPREHGTSTNPLLTRTRITASNDGCARRQRLGDFREGFGPLLSRHHRDPLPATSGADSRAQARRTSRPSLSSRFRGRGLRTRGGALA